MQYEGMSETEYAFIELARNSLKGLFVILFVSILVSYLWEHRFEFRENWRKY
jgi:hypothetical protein